ncbi:MAG: Ig-like domain-containing protein [Lachnospiraceae bacterium]|nr:Ig-like domain-containing protein [Lachnospiraceae bacterium]
MSRTMIEIEDIPPTLANRVKQDLKFRTGNFVWRVRFSTPLDPKTVNKETMYVADSQNQRLNTIIKYDTENELIEVEPLEPYATNEYYYLIITTNVKSRGGQTLGEPVKIKFKL